MPKKSAAPEAGTIPELKTPTMLTLSTRTRELLKEMRGELGKPSMSQVVEQLAEAARLKVEVPVLKAQADWLLLRKKPGETLGGALLRLCMAAGVLPDPYARPAAAKQSMVEVPE